MFKKETEFMLKDKTWFRSTFSPEDSKKHSYIQKKQTQHKC